MNETARFSPTRSGGSRSADASRTSGEADAADGRQTFCGEGPGAAAVGGLEDAAVLGAEDDEGAGGLQARGVDVVREPRQTIVAPLERPVAVERRPVEGGATPAGPGGRGHEDRVVR